MLDSGWMKLLVGLGAEYYRGKNKPKMPKIDAYKPEPMPDRKIEDFAPYLPMMEGMQADTALRMMSGNLPQSVVDQIKSTAGEKAMQGGYSASQGRSRNVTARDLGLNQLDLVQTGMAYADNLYNRAQSGLDQAYSADTAKANQAYDAWASAAELQMARYEDKTSAHNQRVNSVVEALGSFISDRDANKREAEADARADRAEARAQQMTDSLWGDEGLYARQLALAEQNANARGNLGQSNYGNYNFRVPDVSFTQFPYPGVPSTDPNTINRYNLGLPLVAPFGSGNYFGNF